MIKAIIIDDEIRCIQSLRHLIEEYCPLVQIIDECPSAKEGLKSIKSLNPTLVFLDIEMPWMNGFELLEVFDSIDFNVIFTTAYNDFAVKAFRISAIDYLLKPVDPEELISAIEKVIAKTSQGITKEHFEILAKNLHPKSLLQRVALPVGNTFQFVLLNDILYCKADGSYTYVYLSEGKKICVVRRLKQIEALLIESCFCRIHHSILINLNHTLKYVRGDGGYVVMKNGENLTVSRNRKKDLMDKINS